MLSTARKSHSSAATTRREPGASGEDAAKNVVAWDLMYFQWPGRSARLTVENVDGPYVEETKANALENQQYEIDYEKELFAYNPAVSLVGGHAGVLHLM